MEQARYRKLHRFKYQLVSDYRLSIAITGQSIDTRFIKLDTAGNLTVMNGYAWDGPSGPTIDTLNFMRGSLVHDALYQLIRMKCLDILYRKQADQILRKICLEDGMTRFRASYVYHSVRWFAGSCAIPGTHKPDITTCVPVIKETKQC